MRFTTLKALFEIGFMGRHSYTITAYIAFLTGEDQRTFLFCGGLSQLLARSDHGGVVMPAVER